MPAVRAQTSVVFPLCPTLAGRTRPIMLSSAPDQHIIPLIQYLLNNVGKRAYCSDCNDIWAYENKLVLREDLAASEDTTLALP